MNRFDKICAIVAVPAGAFLLLVSVMMLFTGVHFEVRNHPLVAVVAFVLGWTLCITTARAWRMSNELMRYKMKHELGEKRERLREFLEECPEYVEADAELQWSQFKKWERERNLG